MADLVRQAIDVLLHLDRYLHVIIQDYGGWTYLILFLIIFCETGLVVTPFLPGDSLLFAVGAFAATARSTSCRDGRAAAWPPCSATR